MLYRKYKYTMRARFVLASLFYSIAIILNQDHPNYSGIAGLVSFAVTMLILVDPLATYVPFLHYNDTLRLQRATVEMSPEFSRKLPLFPIYLHWIVAHKR